MPADHEHEARLLLYFAPMLHIGCSAWGHDDWTGILFPPGTLPADRLRQYARRLNGVEANTTFYGVPNVPTLQRWAAETPESFTFCPKFPKTITHSARLKDVHAQTYSFIGAMSLLGARLGPLLLQLPPDFSPQKLPTLAYFLERLPPDQRVCVEVRHPDFFTPDAEAALREVLLKNNAGRAIMDSRPALRSTSPEARSAHESKPAVPLVTDPVQPYVLVRLISSPVEVENAPYLVEWAARVIEWLDQGYDVHLNVHCPVERHSPGLARALYRLIRARRSKLLPPLPWDEADDSASQLSLF